MVRGAGSVPAAVVAGLAFAAACSSERTMTNTPRTAMEQLVGSEAADRALRRIRWPQLPGRRVFVEIASPGAVPDQAYVRGAVATELARGGAVVVDKAKSAELIATVLAGSLGTEQTKRFFGIPQMQSLVFPVSIPEVAFYRSVRQTGFAKVEVVVRDLTAASVVFRDGPRSGEAYWAELSVFFFGFYRTDTSRQPPGVLGNLKGFAGRPAEPQPRMPEAVAR